MASSAFGALKGNPHVFVCALITEIEKNVITARPLVIGHLAEDFGGFSLGYANFIEIHVSKLDAFRKLDFSRRIGMADLRKLQGVPEAEVKGVFADAMREVSTDKDWGGELGDLFSANARIEGKSIPCGFMFKGPAMFKKLQPADCGKNGDQIFRLFQYPAQCFVLQHCHSVSPAVRATMRAFAMERFQQRVRYCVIDGYQTYVILRKAKVIR